MLYLGRVKRYTHTHTYTNTQIYIYIVCPYASESVCECVLVGDSILYYIVQIMVASELNFPRMRVFYTCLHSFRSFWSYILFVCFLLSFFFFFLSFSDFLFKRFTSLCNVFIQLLFLCLPTFPRHIFYSYLSLPYIYIYIYIMIKSRFLYGFLSIRFYHPSLPAGLPNYILCPFRAVV